MVFTCLTLTRGLSRVWESMVVLGTGVEGRPVRNGERHYQPAWPCRRYLCSERRSWGIISCINNLTFSMNAVSLVVIQLGGGVSESSNAEEVDSFKPF